MLSRRSIFNSQPNDIKLIMSAGSSNLYDRDINPSGMISLGVAENRLMHHDIVNHINSNFKIGPEALTYGDGSVGSNKLRQNIARFVNTTFRPMKPVKMEHVTVLAGVSSIIDSVSFCLAEKGDGVLLGRPTYVGFISDLVNRAEVKPVLVDFKDKGIEPTSLAAVKCYEDALIEATTNGTPVKGLLLCNPHNPFGTLYTSDVLQEYLMLCAKHHIHFICDEVYANSIFASSDFPNPPSFTSILSMNIEKYIDPSLVHCLYGMSKDFCANGVRIGVLISQNNQDLHAAVRAVSKFAWTSSLADSAWSAILSDQEFMSYFFQKLRSRLSKAYECCVEMLRKHEIAYMPSHSGPFVWIDLSRFLKSPTIESERELAWKMIQHGVWLATGEAYRSETPGTFRLTFAVDARELCIGFERLMTALNEYREQIH